MAERQYQDADGTFVNESGSRQYQDAGGSFVNESVVSGGTEYQVPGGPYVNAVLTRERQMPGYQFLDETAADPLKATIGEFDAELNVKGWF